MSSRFQSLREFFPYYLHEHRDARSRRLHFLGTTGVLASAAASTVFNPIGFPVAVGGMIAIGAHAVRVERKKRPLGHVLAMLALPTAASPVLFPAGVLFAYGCAWIGHLGFEKNRPATFEYPIMSLASDFRMWALMLRGRLWKGDPLTELGLEVREPGEAIPAEVEAAA